MPGERPLATDTALAAEAQQIEIWRRMTPAQKFALLADLNATAILFTEAGIRARHPGIDAQEVRMRRLAVTLGAETMRRAFGWSMPTDDAS